MLVSTSDVIPGNKEVEVLGLVRGNIVTSKHIGRDIMASFKNVVGGEIKSYSMMTNEARQIAEDRMVIEAEKLGADAIISARFASDTVMQGTVEMLAYGTAIKFH
ncbi:MAG: YbjQ family protein [Phoenicibacter congonensis]|uniref:UPF0145 protein Q3982_04430 n=1 Tax=Phoenicibacter congonensis TaxID=1944646 RepID=A0AA43U953_9ACTN|nr:YbjQ family protein [Phoenicibacter congonensis]